MANGAYGENDQPIETQSGAYGSNDTPADAPEPTIFDRVKQGASNTMLAGQIAATDKPEEISSLIADAAKRSLPQSAAQRKMAEEYAPYAKRASEATGVIDNITGYGSAIAKRVGQFASNPKEFAGMVAENLPNSAPGMAGGLLGAAVGGSAGSVLPGVGNVVGAGVGAVAGGTAGGYAIEQGSSMRELVQNEAQARGIDLQDKASMTAMIAEKYPEFLGSSRLKGVGTAGTDAILNAATFGLAGMGERVLAKEARALESSIRSGAIDAATGATSLAGIEAKNAARNTLGAKTLRGAGVVGSEMVGEGLSEGVGQQLGYGKVDAGDVIDEGLLGLGTGLGMAAGRKTIEKVAGVSEPDAIDDSLSRSRAALAAPATAVAESNTANADLGLSVDEYLSQPAAPLQLETNRVIAVPRQDGMGMAPIDRNTGPLSAAAADAQESGLTEAMDQPTGALLKSYPTVHDARDAMDMREDRDRVELVRHPRDNTRWSIVPKSQQDLQSMDDKASLAVQKAQAAEQKQMETRAANEARTQQAEQEDGNAMPAGAENAATTIERALLDSEKNTAPAIANIAQAATESVADTVDEAAHNAATSDLNDRPQPTDAQKSAGNYAKGHIRVGGLDMAIENPVGSTRSGADTNGKPWSVTMGNHYGYIKATTGNDKDQVDTFVKRGTSTAHTGPVFVVDQVDPSTGRFDEHKAMVGFENEAEAKAAYQSNYAKGWTGMKAVTAMSMDQFKAWVKDGPKRLPASQDARVQEAQAAVQATTAKSAPQAVQAVAEEAAQAEVRQSTGKQSTPRLERIAGETDEAYHARRAEAANTKRAERVQTEGIPTQSKDTAAAIEALGDKATGKEAAVTMSEMPDQTEAKEGEISKQSAAFINHVSKLFGKRVVFVSGMSADGMRTAGNVIYLSTQSSVAHLRVLGHEMLHALKAQNAKSYNHMMDAVKGLLTDDEYAAQYKDYYGKAAPEGAELSASEKAFLAEEWMADLSGNRFAEEGFWKDVFTQVEAKHGTEAAKGIVAKLRLALVNALQKLLKLVNGPAFGVDARVAEHLDSIRKAIGEGFAAYAQAVKTGDLDSEAGVSGESKFSGAKDSGRVGSVSTHVLAAQRDERTTTDKTRVSKGEAAIIRDAAKKMGKTIGEVEEMVRDNKGAHPASEGWAQLVLTGVKVDDDGKGELQYQTIPYSFSNGGNGTSLTEGTPEYTAKVSNISHAMLREVRSIYERAKGGDVAAGKIIAQSGWYKEMRTRLRQEFGGMGDLFADLLGATSPNTPVRTNWDNSIMALRLATQGEFDTLLPKWVAWARDVDSVNTQFRARFDSLTADGMNKAQIKNDPEYQWLAARAAEIREFPDNLLPVKDNGKKFGFNGKNVVRALIDLWRVVKNADPDINVGGTAPKAINFSGNLIGFRARATIDVWAARMLQRMAGGLRIPSMAEGGVTGDALESGRNTLQFGFGQDVFGEAVRLIRSDLELSEDPVLRSINDDDLQALVWFIEKEVWTKGNWTSAAGEGGSFEFESDLAGITDRDTVNEQRKIADSSVARSAAQTTAAQDEIARLTGLMAGYGRIPAANSTLEANAAKVADKTNKLSKEQKDDIRAGNVSAREILKAEKDTKAYKDLQRELNKQKGILKKPTTEQRAQMRADAVGKLGEMSRTVDRFTAGISLQKGAEQGIDLPEAAPRFSNKRQTETPEFKRWFGEDSTLVNADGSPMVLYHGTTKQNERALGVFRRSKIGAMGPAIYLGDSKEASAGYADGAMMEVYARGKYLNNRQWTEYVNKSGWAGAEQAARADGFSGVYDSMFENAIAVWDSQDIKSATKNNGKFDPANPDIRFSEKRTEPFYSALSQEVSKLKMQTAPAFGWRDAIKGLVNKGQVKAEEVTGINAWLKDQTGKLTRDQVVAQIDAAGNVPKLSVKRATEGEISAMYAQAWTALDQDPEYKKLDAYVNAAYAASSARYQSVIDKAIELVLASDFGKDLSDTIDRSSHAFKRLSLDIMGKKAEALVHQIENKVSDAEKAKKDYADKYIASLDIPEPSEFSEAANQSRAYYDSAAFQQWFKKSQAVDADGVPLVAFHVTTKDFAIFDVNAGSSSEKTSGSAYTGQLGSWFTAPSMYDGNYDIGNAEVAVEHFGEDANGSAKPGANTMPVHLSIQNAMEYSDFESFIEDRDDHGSIKEFKDALTKSGYDGIVIRNSMTDGNVDRDDWVAFQPNQVKSAIGNSGKFDGENQDIRFSGKRQTETAEFKKWSDGLAVHDSFDEAGSDRGVFKLYHMTTKDFSEFKPGGNDPMASGKAIWLSTDASATSAAFRVGNEERGFRDGARTMPVYAKMKSPLVLDTMGTIEWARSVYADSEFPQLITDKTIAMLKEDGYDSIIYKHDDIFGKKSSSQNEAVVFDAAQIKSAIGNNGQFDGTNPDIRFSTARTFDAPLASSFDDVVYKMQDRHIDTKRVVEAITKSVGRIADNINVYLQEELFHGRAAKRVADFGSSELKPLMTLMRMNGLDLEAVEEYLHARHAKEANALIAQREPSMPDGGSGMTNKAAADYMASLPAAQRAKLETVAKKVDAIIAKTRQTYADYGLESQKTVDAWGSMFKAYVPLMREDKDGGMGVGQGFSVKGKEVKGRTGSTRKVVDIMANIAMQRERAIVRGEKNRVGQALLGLAQANPNPDFWTVRSQAPTERVYDPKKNAVVDRPDMMFKQRDSVLGAKVKDSKGNVVEQFVEFNESDDRAKRMAVALKNLDAGNLEGILGVSAKITRYFSSVNTQYNPVFGVVNLIRDVQGAMINLGSTPLAGKQAAVAKDTLAALSGIYGDIRQVRKGGVATSKWATLWEQMQADGGTTGYRDLFKTSTDRANALKDELNPDAWMDSKLGKALTANGALKAPMSTAKSGSDALFGWLSDYNEAMENGVRLAAYKAALDAGMTRQQAASLSKNLTVNFNRKGQVGQQAGALYAFFNAAMQGTAKIGQTLFDMDGGDIKTLRLSPLGKKVVYGGMLLGSMQALALAAAGFSDEDPPEFLRERSLIIPTGGKGYVSIPMPLGLHVIPGLGRHATEFALSGFTKPAKRAISMFGMFADAFNPIGNSGLSIQTIAPTAIDPLVALTENKDWTGKPIARVSSNKALPGHAQWKDTATGWSKVLAEGINLMSGGNQYVAGALSPTPDQIDYLIAQATGGVGREISKIEQTTKSLVRGEEIPTFKIPLAGRFYGNSASQASEGTQFYANADKLNELETEMKGLRKDGKHAEANALMQRRPEARLIMQVNHAELQVQKLKREKRAIIATGGDRALVRAKEEQITAVMARTNRATERLMEH